MDKLSDGLKKILLAGIGTAATTAEKSKEILDDMVKKGELTVEQGKVLNRELKHNIKETVKEKMNGSDSTSTPDALKELLGKMSPEDLKNLKDLIQKVEEEQMDEAEEGTADADKTDGDGADK
ncbi:MAG TPA: hypothetical protein IAB26_12945 [Candidatus Limivivens merdigallinarum]|uniref:Polyhydroxyalkanoate synthesis regulator phasin n=1 Tax=Candidatus Limivivens merdigallinarum TaxID=2840859 RepID=A0A9D0ZZD6_9FIRM|nr:hypothetical protein [Candidatus Limivivens merdigallinarum]